MFDTLLALAEEPGRVLEKDHLLSKIWPGTFVEAGSLARIVSTLRKVLGRSPGGHEYIETIQTRGCRFKAGVARRTAAVPAPGGLDQDTPVVAPPDPAIPTEDAAVDVAPVSRPASGDA